MLSDDVKVPPRCIAPPVYKKENEHPSKSNESSNRFPCDWNVTRWKFQRWKFQINEIPTIYSHRYICEDSSLLNSVAGCGYILQYNTNKLINDECSKWKMEVPISSLTASGLYTIRDKFQWKFQSIL